MRCIRCRLRSKILCPNKNLKCVRTSNNSDGAPQGIQSFSHSNLTTHDLSNPPIDFRAHLRTT